MPDLVAMSADAQRHLQAFLRAVGLSIVDGSMTCHFGNGDVRKVEVTTFHAVRLASHPERAYPDRTVSSS